MKFDSYKIIFLLSVLFTSCNFSDIPETPVLKGVKEPVISLNGEWKISLNPPDEAESFTGDEDYWKKIQVPGEVMAQGFTPMNNTSFYYFKVINIPSDYDGSIIKLRFDGTSNYAKVLINGKTAGEHRGGFTSWTCDITELVEPGSNVRLIVEMQDKIDDPSYASGYAFHQVAGMLRDVSLVALPQNYISSFYYETELDEQYRDAVLKLNFLFSEKDNYQLLLDLYDPDGEKMKLENEFFEISDSIPDPVTIALKNPKKWTAESPHLYTLVYELQSENNSKYRNSIRIGFREIEIKGNKILVNGEPVTLRGINRHDLHPEFGRMTTRDIDALDAELIKKANINFVKTTHYPPSRSFMEYCDEYGIYTAIEAPVMAIDTGRSLQYSKTDFSGSEMRILMLAQLDEMLNFHRNHPSCIMWSIGSQSVYNENFSESYKMMKHKDPTRPVIFSYAGTVPDSIPAYDILNIPRSFGSDHFQEIKKIVNNDIPVLIDQFVHIPCHNKPELIQDGNVRDFWGITVDSVWMQIMTDERITGGTVQSYVDETFFFPVRKMAGFKSWWGKVNEGSLPYEFTDFAIGSGAWGIVDVWRNTKPEYWNLKKAYAPVKLNSKFIEKPASDNHFEIGVKNQFNHTNLQNVRITISSSKGNFHLSGPDISPGNNGILKVPAEYADENGKMTLSFYKSDTLLVNRYNVGYRNDSIRGKKPKRKSGEIDLIESDIAWEIRGDGFEIRIDRIRGEILSGRYNEYMVFTGGPNLHVLLRGDRILSSIYDITNAASKEKVMNATVNKNENSVRVRRNLTCDSLSVQINFVIYSDGSIETDYTIEGLPENYIREIGLKFRLSESIDSISWRRKGYWSYYPEEHLSSLEGRVPVRIESDQKYAQKPALPWHYQVKDFYYLGLNHDNYKYNMSRTVRSSKTNILEYSIHFGNSDSLTVAGTGKEACRLSTDATSKYLIMNNYWDYPGSGDEIWFKGILPEQKQEGSFLINY